MTCECLDPGGGFGTGPFGTGPFGTGFGPDALALGGAQLLAANLAAVNYEGDPGLANPGNQRSPLFPFNWHLVPLDPEIAVPFVQHVVEVPDAATQLQYTDDYPLAGLLTPPFFLVWFDANLTPGGRYLLELILAEALAPGCDCVELVGLTLRRDAIPTDERDGARLQDLANPSVPRDVLQQPALLGTYQLTDTGDFGLDKSSEASLRKRLIRRVTTAANGFFHLPGYGAMPKLKGLLTVDAAERLQARIRAQVLQEPDVVDASVVVRQVLGFSGTVTAAITAIPVGGNPVGLVVPIQVP